MDRAYQSGASGSAPAAPASPSTGYPTAGNAGTGTAATKPGPYWYHMIMEELMAIISSAGITPDKASLNQVASAIQSGKLFCSAAGGTADALTAAFAPAITTLVNGMAMYVRAASANATTTPTFTPASGAIAAKTIVKGAGSTLVAGDIAGGGHWVELQYDATLDKWVLLNPATGIYPQNGKNLLINGNFDFWQIGASFSANGYSADQWFFTPIGTCTLTPTSYPVPGSDVGATWTTGAAASYGQLFQPIEQVVVKKLRGKSVTFSVYVAASSFSGQLQLGCYYSNSSDTYSSLTTAVGSNTVFTPTAGYVRYSLTVTVPSDAVGMKFGIIPSAAQASGVTVGMAQAQLEIGGSPSAYDFKLPSVALAECQRFLEKSYPQGVYANGASGVTSGAHFVGVTTADAVGNNPFKVVKRTSPTITFYAPPGGSGSGSARNDSATSVVTGLTANDVSEYGWNRLSGSMAAGNGYSAHFIADARL